MCVVCYTHKVLLGYFFTDRNTSSILSPQLRGKHIDSLPSPLLQ
jgi:hypothetical protein